MCMSMTSFRSKAFSSVTAKVTCFAEFSKVTYTTYVTEQFCVFCRWSETRTLPNETHRVCELHTLVWCGGSELNLYFGSTKYNPVLLCAYLWGVQFCGVEQHFEWHY
jgi:hypothetical protein